MMVEGEGGGGSGERERFPSNSLNHVARTDHSSRLSHEAVLSLSLSLSLPLLIIILASMPNYHPMKKHMDKLDAWGAATSSKLKAQSSTAAGTSMRDRLSLAKSTTSATDLKWNATGRQQQPELEAAASGARGPPPAPPPRGGAAAGVVRPAGPPPTLPPRSGNEAGTVHPPPPYGAVAPPPSLPRRTSAAAVTPTRYIEFSKFTQQDKLAFFAMLDEVITPPAQLLV